MIPIRHAKVCLLRLGLSSSDVNVIIAAIDKNGDGYLDVFDLERLQVLARRARACVKVRQRHDTRDHKAQGRHKGLVIWFPGGNRVDSCGASRMVVASGLTARPIPGRRPFVPPCLAFPGCVYV
jgi:hypothetical protein